MQTVFFGDRGGLIIFSMQCKLLQTLCGGTPGVAVVVVVVVNIEDLSKIDCFLLLCMNVQT
eukprot:2472602-Ditylum_brightwellii.AAC.1